jgi:hypothetical protein
LVINRSFTGFTGFNLTSPSPLVNRDLANAGGGISPDWRFGIAYNAALKLCTILSYAEGYRAAWTLQH